MLTRLPRLQLPVAVRKCSTTTKVIRPRRSFLFVPGLEPEKMAPKALSSGTDIVCFELEDAIAPQHKKQARETVIGWFERNGADAVASSSCGSSALKLNSEPALFVVQFVPSSVRWTRGARRS